MHTADEVREVLLLLRLRGSTADVSAAHADLLPRLELAGLVEQGGGGRWRLAADGRAEGQRLLAAELDAARARPVVAGAHERFVALNGMLLRVCTDWQLRNADPSSIVVNDHADAAYDAAVLARLDGVHRGVLPVCADLTDALGRFGGYATRLTDAHARITHGDVAALDEPAPTSYHGTWFELHEDLVATLGIDRGSEPLPDTGPPTAGWPPA